ncbi:hypothetical protein B0F90DRAFT_1751338, partial [Multifurca ochricompacta]
MITVPSNILSLFSFTGFLVPYHLFPLFIHDIMSFICPSFIIVLSCDVRVGWLTVFGLSVIPLTSLLFSAVGQRPHRAHTQQSVLLITVWYETLVASYRFTCARTFIRRGYCPLPRKSI